MDNSTKKLLEECSVGCKMGIESMEQVQHHVTDAKIAATIEKSCSKHKELEEEISKILLRAGQPEKEPGVIVSTFSWMTTGVKMMTGEDEKDVYKRQDVNLSVFHTYKGFLNTTLTHAQGFYLCSCKGNAGFISIFYKIIMKCLFIIGNQLHSFFLCHNILQAIFI